MYTTALQNGTEKDDKVLDVAGGYDGLVVLTGNTQGNWSQANHGGNDSFAVILDSKHMVSESGRTVAPTASETSPPTSYAPSPQSFVPSLPTSSPSIPGLLVSGSPSRQDFDSLPHTSAPSTPGLLVSDAPPRQDLESLPPTSAPSTSWLESFSSAPGKASPPLLAVVLSLVVTGVLLVCVGLAVVRHRRKVRGAQSSPIVSSNRSNTKHTEKANNGKWKKGATSSLRYAVRGSLANKQRATSSKALQRRTSETGRTVWRTKSVHSATVGGIVSEGLLQRSKLTESTPTLMAYDENVPDELKYDVDPENPVTSYSPRASARSDSGRETSSQGLRKLSGSASDDVSVSGGVQGAARRLADKSSLPVVREAASLVSIIASLMETTDGNAAGMQGKQRRCLSIMRMLRRAAEVLGKVINALIIYFS